MSSDNRIVISFIVIAYNESKSVKECIQSILRLAGLEQYELLFIDDNSTDNTVEIVKEIAKKFKSLKIFVMPQNSGRGAVREYGVKKAKGGLIAMIDGDIVLPKDWLLTCRNLLHTYDAVSFTPVPDGDAAYLYQRYRFKPKIVSSSTTITGSNGLYYSKIFKTINFNPNLKDGEDTNFSYLMRENGLALYRAKERTVLHNEHKSFKESTKWMMQYGIGASLQLKKHHKIRTPDMSFMIVICTVVVSVILAFYTDRAFYVVFPFIAISSMSTLHIHGKFYLFQKNQITNSLKAICIDSIFLSSYYLGRVFGLLK